MVELQGNPPAELEGGSVHILSQTNELHSSLCVQDSAVPVPTLAVGQRFAALTGCADVCAQHAFSRKSPVNVRERSANVLSKSWFQC